MRISFKIQLLLVELIRYVYVLLFVYAALSKMIDFENFEVQLGQSPMLREYVFYISYGIPAIELLLALFLLFERTKLLGFYGSFAVMTLFSTYLFMLIQYSDYVPCSCGGILEKMGWEEHLVFNIIFLILAFIAIRSIGIQQNSTIKQQSKFLIPLFFISAGVIIFQHVRTDKVAIAQQNFIRHFPHHPIQKQKQFDLLHNSYYIAGFQDNKIFLGNVTAPLAVTVIDMRTYKKENFTIQLPKSNLRFRSLRLIVSESYFYFYDGTTPVIYRGSIANWLAKQWLYKAAYFTHMVPVDSTSIAIKALSSTSHENVLGRITKKDTISVSLHPKIIVKQADGIFDTDGMLVFNPTTKHLVYTYFYRNEFLVIPSNFKSHQNFKTIDKTEIAKVKTVSLKQKNKKVLAEQPVTVNKNSTSFADYLLIQSGIMGNYEPKDTWNTAAIIDTYAISTGTYQFSFYIPHQAGKTLNSFALSTSKLIAINGQYLTLYQLKAPF